MSSVINADFDWDVLTRQALVMADIEKGGRVQTAIDNAVIRYCTPYVPMKTGLLAQSPNAASKIGQGEIVWETPYAHYMYYGEVYGPNIPVFEDDSGVPTRYFSRPGQKKHPTGKKLQYDTSTNPQAGPFWFERMKANHASDILEEAKRVAGIK